MSLLRILWIVRWHMLLLDVALVSALMGMAYKGSGVPFWGSYLADWASIPGGTLLFILMVQWPYSRLLAPYMGWTWVHHRRVMLYLAAIVFLGQCNCEIAQRYIHTGVLAGTYDPWDFLAFGLGFAFTALCLWRGVRSQERAGIMRAIPWSRMTPSVNY
jgi:hypothetical protein